MKLIKVILSLQLVFSTNAYAGAGEAAVGVGVGVAATMAYKKAVANGAANTTAGEGFKKKCSPYSVNFCVMAAMAVVMIGVSLATAKKAKGIEDDLSCAKTNSCFNDGGGGADSNPNNGNPNPNLNRDNPIDRTLVDLEREGPAAKKFLNDLEKKGYKINRQTGAVTDPSGNSYSSASDAMNGMTPQQRADAENILKEAAKEGESLLKRLEEYDEEYGGGGGSSVAAGGYNSGAANGGRFGVPSANLAKQPSVAGLSVNHGGDRIGVAGDNIFDMIHRRYETTKPGMNPNPTGP